MSYSIGPRLKKFREAKHLTQKQFGKLLHVSDARISNWENGVNRPDVDILVKICEILEVSADVLLDIRLRPEDMTEQERRMLMAYRAKPEMQNAVNILLDIHEHNNGNGI